MVKQRMIFWGSVLSVLLLVSEVFAGEIRVSLDRKSVLMNESFSLSFEAEDGVDDDPNFSPLNKDFEIVRQNQGSSMQFINGQVTQKKTWNLSLIARKPGRFLIPQISFGKDRSTPLVIEIKTAGSKKTPQDEALFLEVNAEPTTAYIQSQILYTLRLYRSVNLTDADLSAPQLTDDDAVVVKLGEDREFETTRSGKRYRVIERRYAIFPQKSGTVTIAPTRFEGRIANRSRSMFGPFAQGGSIKRLSSRSIELQIEPVPQDRVQGRWLPAKSLRLLDRWPENTAPDELFRVGEPVTWTVLLLAEGLTAAQLPEISLNLPSGFKSYPDQPVMEDETKESGIIGIRQEKIALIPTQSGPQTLPAIEIPWWNVKTKKMEVARIAKRKIIVLPALPSSAPTQPQSGEQAQPLPISPLSPTRSADSSQWPYISLVLGLGWLVTGIAWWRARCPVKAGIDTPEENAAPQRRTIRSQLKAACRSNDAAASKSALTAWGRLMCPDRALEQTLDAALRLEFKQLNNALYGPSSERWTGGSALWSAFENQEKGAAQKSLKGVDGLSPLYP